MPALVSTYATLLDAYRLPTLQVTFPSDAHFAASVRMASSNNERLGQLLIQQEQNLLALQELQQQLQGGAAQDQQNIWAPGQQQQQQQRQPGSQPHPQQPYYNLSAPLIHSLTALLAAAPQPGRHIRRLELHLSTVPAPQALAPLAALPSLDHLELLGGGAAFLEAGHLAALSALQGLTALSLSGVWDMQRPQRRQPHAPHPGAAAGDGMMFPPGPGAGPNVLDDDEDDIGAVDLPFGAAPAFGGAGLAAAGPMGAGGNAAAAAMEAEDEDEEREWPELFGTLERLRVLRLCAVRPLTVHAVLAHRPRGEPLVLDLHHMTRLQELRVLGRDLDPQVLRLGTLQQLSRLELDRQLSGAEWSVVRTMEGLTEATLRGPVSGQCREPSIIGRTVTVYYGSYRNYGNQLSFPLPDWWRHGGAAGGSSSGLGLTVGAPGGSGGGGVGAGQGGQGHENGGVAAAGMNLFAAAAAGRGRNGNGGAAAEGSARAFDPEQRLRQLSRMHLNLEPLRFLSDNTSLMRLKLHWSQPTYDVDEPRFVAEADDDGPQPAGQPNPRAVSAQGLEDAVLAARLHARNLAALSELQHVDLCSPGGELVLDGSLLEALAPAWRRLRQFAFTGVVMPTAVAALGLFLRLQDLSLHDQALTITSGPAQQQSQHTKDKLLVVTSALPAALERLALTNANVLHVPGAGPRGLQRLELRHRCRWQAGKAPPGLAAARVSAGGGHEATGVIAPGSSPARNVGPAAGPTASPGVGVVAAPTPVHRCGPWLMSGMPLLTHLDLQFAPLGPTGLRAVVRSCGSQLRSLSFSVPHEQSEAAQMRAILAESGPLLPNLARLLLTLWEAPNWFYEHLLDARSSASPGLPDEALLAEHPPHAGLAGPAGQGQHPEGVGGGPFEAAARAAAAAAAAAWPQRWRMAFQPLTDLVGALLAAAGVAVETGSEGGGSAASAMAVNGPVAGLPALRELWLRVPWRGPNHNVELNEGRLRSALMHALAGVGKLTRLEEVRLAGPLVARAGEALETRLLADLPHCHVLVTRTLRKPAHMLWPV